MVKVHWRKSRNDEATLCGMWGKQWIKTRERHAVTCKHCLRAMSRMTIIEDPKPRRIVLTLANDTTETECGACRCVTEVEGRDICGAFGGELAFDDKTGYRRLEVCLAAEARP
jgi:hypothetical protein